MNLSKKITALQNRLTLQTARREKWRNRRLLLALVLFGVLTIATYLKLAMVQAICILLFLVVFVPMVVLTQRLTAYLEKLECLLKLYQRIHNRTLGVSEQSPYGSINIEPELAKAALNRDLNLFSGTGLSGHIDEFMSSEASQEFANNLLVGLGSEELIKEEQKLVEELSHYSGFIRRSLVYGYLGNDKRLVLEDFKKLVLQQAFDGQGKMLCLAACLTWLVVLSLGVASFFVSLGGIALMAWALFAILSLMSLGAGSRLFALSLALQGESNCSKLFHRLEALASRESFQKSFPVLSQRSISKSLLRLERISHFLSTQAHPIIHFGLNLLVPWSSFFALVMEKERVRLQGKITPSCEEFRKLDRLASSALFFKYQTQCFPEVSGEGSLKAKQVFHPLLDRTKATANDFEFPEGANQILITGSNMSGKSTFMRTIAINQLLALAGLPVFAKNMSTAYRSVVTCIQVSDSLDEGLSSFYAEVVCLKKLFERVQSEKVFYFVDEIFRGTNNRERLIGSKAFLKEMAKFDSLGIVTTHDLELAELEGQLQGLRNFHFRDEIHEGRMSFPYKIFSGVCPTTNALKIMQSEGLPVTV